MWKHDGPTHGGITALAQRKLNRSFAQYVFGEHLSVGNGRFVLPRADEKSTVQSLDFRFRGGGFLNKRHPDSTTLDVKKAIGFDFKPSGAVNPRWTKRPELVRTKNSHGTSIWTELDRNLTRQPNLDG